MTAIPPGLNLPDGYDDVPPPGGVRRFIVAVVVAGLLLTGVVAGMIYWMNATASSEYRGPEKLKKPDYPYYR